MKHGEETHQLMELKGSKKRQEDDDRMTICGLSKETRDTLREMLDFSLLKDPIFIVFTVSNFCTSVGFNIPYVYLVVSTHNELEFMNFFVWYRDLISHFKMSRGAKFSLRACKTQYE
jgi:hypothetical protein